MTMNAISFIVIFIGVDNCYKLNSSKYFLKPIINSHFKKKFIVLCVTLS